MRLLLSIYEGLKIALHAIWTNKIRAILTTIGIIIGIVAVTSMSTMIDALFYGGLRKIETRDDNGQLQEPWRPAHILHYMQDRPFEPDFVFDISDTIDIKEKAILAFETQFYADEDDDGPQTYISSKEFFEGIKARGRHYGHLIGVKYGEPFKYYNGPVPLKSFGSFFESSPFR